MSVRGIKLVCFLVAFSCLLALVTCEEDDNYSYSYLDYDYSGDGTIMDNTYGYYDNVDENYYDVYGEYPNDLEGAYADYYSDGNDTSALEDCVFDGSKPVFSNGTLSCNLLVSGGNSEAVKLNGGVDGIYELSGCYNGKPLYQRVNSSAGEDRVLYYSSTFGDWDFNRGTTPDDSSILIYGGDMEHLSTPAHVENWQILASYVNDEVSGDDDDFTPVSLQISCADGTKVPSVAETAQLNDGSRTGPLLTDEELDAKYQFIYDKYGRSSTGSVSNNFTFVTLLVVTGLSTVLLIRYFLAKRKGKGVGNSPATTFVQLVSMSKHKLVGHTQ